MNPKKKDDQNGDYDNDGLTNVEEQILNTHPLIQMVWQMVLKLSITRIQMIPTMADHDINNGSDKSGHDKIDVYIFHYILCKETAIY